ncbi:hypothetical protein BH09MYX1_BH09MYX1_12880 [soil metagenome]
MMKRLRWLGGRVLLLLVGTFVALLLGEIAVRVGGLGPHRYPELRHVENEGKTAAVDLYPTNPRGSFDVDLHDAAQVSAIVGKGIPLTATLETRTPFGVQFSYSASRCRDRAFAPPTAGVKRIIVIGDSFTEGQGVREDDTFVRRIDRAWHADPSAEAMEIYNCGRRGRDFPALRESFDALLAEAPDVVVYAMVLNDPEQSASFRDRQQFLNDWIVDRRRTTEGDGEDLTVHGSKLWAAIDEKLESARVARATTQWYLDLFSAPNREGWEATQRSLSEMDAAMRARGGKLVIATLPLMVRLEGGYPFVAAHAAIADACTRHHLQCHDTLAAFTGMRTADLWVHAVDLHPNDAAHAVIAADLLPWLRAL